MAVTKRIIPLSETLGHYLAYTPGYAETAQFNHDLHSLCPTLLRDAILELQQSPTKAGVGQIAKRRLIHEVYTRKVKELAALYPILYAVENTLRATASQKYFNVFGGNSYWWRPILVAVDSGLNHQSILAGANGKKTVANMPVNPAFVRSLFYAFENMTNSQRSSLRPADVLPRTFYESITLKNLCSIILADWSITPIPALQKTPFEKATDTIATARNDLFHSRPIKSRATVFKACEAVLDASDIHLGDFDALLANAPYSRIPASVQRLPRHLSPPT